MKRNRLIMILISVLVVILIAFSLESFQKNLILLNLLLLLLSASIIWEELTVIWSFKKGFEEMNFLEQSIRGETNNDNSYAMLMFSKYIRTKMNTPQISQKIYEKNNEALNQSWNNYEGVQNN